MNKVGPLTSPVLRVTIVVAGLLLIPLIAQIYTDEVNWTIIDFLVAGSLLFGTGYAYILISRLSKNIVYRVALGLALASILLLLWSNFAVGIIGSENNSINLLYLGVLLVGSIGALLNQFKPRGLSFTLLAMTCTQVAISIFAIFQDYPGSSNSEIIIVNGVFIVMFLLSAVMFQYVARQEREASHIEET